MIILGFDISSTTYGWAVLKIENNNISYIDSGYFKPPKDGSIIERLAKTRDTINNLLKQYDPDCIGIENIVEFMKGHSTAKTIIMQTSFNRMTCLAGLDFLKNKNNNIPELFSVLSIRHGIKLNKILPKKEDIPDLVAKHLNITFPWQYKKMRGKTAQKPVVENYDRADAIAVALYYALILTGKIKKKK